MSAVYVSREAGATPAKLGTLLGEGAAGKVYSLPSMPGLAAKLYHGVEECRRFEAKIDAMIASPPDLPPAQHNGVRFPQIAWPQGKLYDARGRFIGFLMPEIDFARSTSLVNLLQKSSRRAEKLSHYYGYRVLVARNLASVAAELHRAGHRMIDMKPANLRFYPAVSWMAVVDTDGFSISGKGGRIAAERVSDEYIAPEGWKRPPGELDEPQDRFALAVIIFQLLNNGVHPFAGGLVAGTSHSTDLQARIVEGLYPYGLAPGPAGLVPSAASIHRMFRRSTRMLFDRAFLGAGARPSAAEWREHLDQLVGLLVPCEAKPTEHAHFGAGCGFCGHEARIVAAARPARPRVAPKPRKPIPISPPRPIGQGPAQMRFVSYNVATTARAPRRRSMWPLALIALAIGGGAATLASDQIRDRLMLASRMGMAPAIAAPAEPRGSSLATAPLLPADESFDRPRSYLPMPEGAGLTLALRAFPDAQAVEIGQLGLGDPVLGSGASQSADGARWILVTRTSDGASGYVRERELIARVQGAECDPLAADCGVAFQAPRVEPRPVAEVEVRRELDAPPRPLLSVSAYQAAQARDQP